MKFKFKKDTEIECVVNYDEDKDEAEYENELMPKDEIHDVDLLDDHGETIDVQFRDGSCCYGLNKKFIKILELDES